MKDFTPKATCQNRLTAILNSIQSCKVEQKGHEAQNVRKKAAFTLAEVLITLGIIGVVAAMAIPTIAHKLRNKVLKSQFKNTYALATQAIKRMQADMGVTGVGSYCTYYNSGYVNTTECQDAFQKVFNTSPVQSNNYYSKAITRKNISVFHSKDILAAPTSTSCTMPLFRQYALANGAYIGYTISCGGFWIGIDINGAAKPNRLGYDVFLYYISPTDDKLEGSIPLNISDKDLEDYKNKLDASNSSSKEYYYNSYGVPCSYTSTQTLNGIGCAYYAIRNKCPDGSNKGYFECLK
jgi:prepilin-type N-terminal cleavage/methylation domain-containing protein